VFIEERIETTTFKEVFAYLKRVGLDTVEKIARPTRPTVFPVY
jgi:hypothetical protein